jgi:hypothetical protein
MDIEIKCSNGWLHRFKESWNIKWQAMSGEGVTVDIDSAEKCHKNVTSIFTHHAPKDVFNVDVNALFYVAQQKRTLALKREKCEGWKGMRTKRQFYCVVMQMEGKNFVL